MRRFEKFPQEITVKVNLKFRASGTDPFFFAVTTIGLLKEFFEHLDSLSMRPSFSSWYSQTLTSQCC